MRVIGGRLKGRRITVPKNLPVRPTTDKAKEGLFNILNNNLDFEDLIVLDLCSGTGNIAIEFASRGAREVTCVDVDKHCVAHIRDTARLFTLPIHTVMADAARFVQTCRTKYDVIFCDLPYSSDLHRGIVEDTLRLGLLAPDGQLIVEHSKETPLSDVLGFMKSRNYGRVMFSFFTYP